MQGRSRVAPLALASFITACSNPTAPPAARDATEDPATPPDDVTTALDDATVEDVTTPSMDATAPPVDQGATPPTDAGAVDRVTADRVAMDVSVAVDRAAPVADSGGTTPSMSAAVWTSRNDNARTGATLSETRLTTSNVAPGRFGLLFSRAVEGQVYAQPLYVPGVAIPGRGARNVVFVATEHNLVYAFDADDPAVSAPYWTANLGPPMPAVDIMGKGPCHNILVEVGITSTPVIDLATNTMYVLAKTREGTSYFHRLHALDIATGRPRAGSPTTITASTRGTGLGTDEAGLVHLEPRWSHARPGLALANGVVYATFASHCDREVYHGWVLAYDAATLRQRAAFNTTRDGQNGGIWQSGTAPSIDETGDVYFTVGDGTATPDTTPPQLGNSVGRLRLAGAQLNVVDFFTPHNHAQLFERDMDLGSTGVLLIPRTRLALVGSKEGLFYLLNRDSMGRYRAGNDGQIVQSFLATHMEEARNIHGTPVYWDSPAGPRIYVWGEEDVLKAFRFDGRVLETRPVSVSAMRAAAGMPGGMLSLSARGSAAGTGIVWSSMPLANDAVDATVPGILRAFDATNLSRELWNSQQDPRDAVGNFAKFCPPTVANGRVYLATFSNRLNVYGLR